MFDSVSNPEAYLQVQNSFNELTVSLKLRLVKIAVRVLLDSVSFSRIMSSRKCLSRADLISIPVILFFVNTFFELFLNFFDAAIQVGIHC